MVTKPAKEQLIRFMIHTDYNVRTDKYPLKGSLVTNTSTGNESFN